MEPSSPFKTLWQTFSLVLKIVFTLAAGALLVALITASLHFRLVHVGLKQAEQQFDQGRLEEANALAARLEPWARCFPGRYRKCALVRVRCLARLKQPEAAARMAEALRSHADRPMQPGNGKEFAGAPLVWLQKTSLFMTGGILDAAFPVIRLNEWAGYSTLLDELVSLRDVDGLNALADDLIARFPHSQIGVLANSARGELRPASPVVPSHAVPLLRPSTQTALPPAGGSVEPGVSTSAVPSLTSEPALSLPEPPHSWGIVTNPAAMALNPQTGQAIRPLKVGDVLAIEGTCSFQNVPAFTGTLILNNRNVPDLAFYGKDLDIREGAFDAVSPEEVALRSRLAEIQAEETVLAPKAARELANLGPEETAYRQAKTKMESFQQDVNALNAKLQSRRPA